MSSDWIEISLGEVASLQRGHDLPTQDREDGDVPIMGSFGITGYHSESRVSGPGVVIGRSGGSMGVVSFIHRDYWPLNTVLFVTDFHGNDERFVFYLLKTINFQAYNTGSAQASLNRNYVHPIKVNIPKDINEQRRIAKVLSDLEDKIEVNHQINQTLEQIAQAIFKSWFVDFEPVKAKMEAKQNGQAPERAAMRAISGKTDEELDQLSPEQSQQLTTTTALFPDELEDDAQGSASAAGGRKPGAASELGEIPKGWAVMPLSQMIELIGGGTPKRSEESYWGGNIPWFSVKDAPSDGNVYAINTDETITELGLNKSSAKLLQEGVTIISARGTVGRLAMVGVPMAMNQSCYGVKAGTGIGSAFNYFNLKHAISTLQQQTHGAVFDTITTSTFNSVYAVKPCVNSAKEFERLVAPLLKNIKGNLFESATLAECRDSLLPKLLSGEVSLGDAQTTAEAVA